MNNSNKRVLIAGSCLLTMGVCMCGSIAGEIVEVKPDAFVDSIRFASPSSQVRLDVWKADDVAYDMSGMIAQVGGVSGSMGLFLQANSAGVNVGVTQEFSTWSDLTAIFRPSRWKSPFKEGGFLSWLNYNAWAAVPDRTAKILLGEVIVVGATYAIASGGGGHDDSTTVTPVAAATSSGDSGGGVTTTSVASPSTNTGGGTTSTDGGASVPPPVVPPVNDGGESPF